MLGLAADYWHIIRNSLDGLTVEVYQNSILFAANRPCIAVLHPVVRFFLLEAVYNRLLEQTVLVANAIAVQRQIQGCSTVEEAGSQPSQTAVTEGSVFDFFERSERCSHFLQSGFYFFVAAQTEQVVKDCPSN